MKKIIATLALIFSLTSATFAYDGASVNKSVLKSFNKEFSGAGSATWQEVGSGILRASFDYSGKNVSAFFNSDGDVIATSVSILEDHLPLAVAKALNDKYGSYSKKEIVEYIMENETKYLVTLTNDQNTFVVKVSGNGSVEVYKK